MSNHNQDSINMTVEYGVQVDRSGVGHAWTTCGESIPANVAEEIACEIIDGGKEECAGYTASNGLTYRW